MNSKLSLHAFSPIHAKSIIANHSQMMDKIIVGSNQFGLRQVTDFSIDDIEVVAAFAHKFEIKCYVAVNKIMHNRDLEPLTEYLKALKAVNVDGVIFSDLAVPQILEIESIALESIYSTETTITNSSFTHFANVNDITGVETAKEITLEEVNELAAEKSSQVMVQIHGHLYMYQSIRNMVDNFSQFQDKNMNSDDAMYLYDSERKRAYPLIQNEQGTHMLSSNNLAMIHKLNELDLENIDSLRIDPLLYTPTEYNQIVELYIKALTDLDANKEEYIAKARSYLKELKIIKPEQKYGTGFFYKKTMF
ncbi:peptidase U32 family protein [Mollicutes bacterium LVI A0078]|nr:peptidase U32 family protein [Mollicutes bacterium LVI A0075]WOO91147.1 peptidase U32 family protein [Mollicutes bacterium LVI A0078]